jgi:hypothetical protein
MPVYRHCGQKRYARREHSFYAPFTPSARSSTQANVERLTSDAAAMPSDPSGAPRIKTNPEIDDGRQHSS